MADNKEETDQKTVGWKIVVAKHMGVLATLIALLLIALSLIVYQSVQRNRAAFVIANKSYSKQLIRSMAAYVVQNQPQAKQQAAKNIFELYKEQAAAQKVGIIPNAAEVQAQYQELPKPKNDIQRQYISLFAYDLAVSASYRRYESGQNKGYEFVFGFDRYVKGPAVGEKSIAGYGDTNLISQDKAYAYQQAKAAYDDYKAKKISADNLVAKIRSDSRLVDNDSNGGSFDSSKGILSGQLFSPDIFAYVSKQTRPGLSPLNIGKVPSKFPTGPGDYADGYYYFVDLQQASHIIPDPAGAVQQQMSKLQAVYYGI